MFKFKVSLLSCKHSNQFANTSIDSDDVLVEDDVQYDNMTLVAAAMEMSKGPNSRNLNALSIPIHGSAGDVWIYK